MTRWPGGARSVVLLTVSLQGDREILGPEPGYSGMDKTLSTSRYGLWHGVDALLDRLDRAGLPSTWFVPGLIVQDHPDVVARVRYAGAAIGVQGWDVVPLTGIDPGPPLDRALAALDRIGVAPDGFRLPRGEWPLGLVDQLLSRGIRWSSSFESADLPFRLPGATGALVELPFHRAMEDRQAFVWNYAPAMPTGHARIACYDDVLDNWLAELRAAHAEGGMWVLSLHPEIMGTPGRLGVLADLLAVIAALPGCRPVSGPELATWWAAAGHADPPDHPLPQFLAASGRPHL